jgi:hypothetical protein
MSSPRFAGVVPMATYIAPVVVQGSASTLAATSSAAMSIRPGSRIRGQPFV